MKTNAQIQYNSSNNSFNAVINYFAESKEDALFMRPDSMLKHGLKPMHKQKGFETRQDAENWLKEKDAEMMADFLSATQVLNLTQHTATAEQADAGVVEPEDKAAVQSALTFDAIPSAEEIRQRAEFLAHLAKDAGYKKAMIGGAPFFMAPLERALLSAGVTPVYAFSARDSKEEPDGNGGVKKVNVFRHVGFVEAA
jgi:hypothetical protein